MKPFCFRWSAVHLVLAGIVFPMAAPAFDTEGAKPSGTATFALKMEPPGSPTVARTGITDGSVDWNVAVSAVASIWNPMLSRTQMATPTSGTADSSFGNGVNDVFFSSTIYGQAFGARVLAVTLVRSSGSSRVRIGETDIIFNTAMTWGSYRGPLIGTSVDIRRVAVHEFGHALGLQHPDQATPPQSVPAIMNSVVSNTEVPQTDDIAGANALYGAPLTQPVITSQSASQAVVEGGAADLRIALNGGEPPPPNSLLDYAWFFTPTGGQPERLFTVHDWKIPLGVAQVYDAGSYTVTVETPDSDTLSSPMLLTVASVVQDATTRLANLSTRGIAGSNDRTMIVGFVVAGDAPRRILLRAVGPTLGLAPFNVSGTVADPTLELFPDGGAVIASNDDWDDDGAAAALRTAFQQAGAFDLPDGSNDAALIATLAPGKYTAQVHPKSGVEGVALVEAYDLDDIGVGSRRLLNLSTRGFVGTGDNVMIAGLVVEGPGPRRYLLRVAGDTLQNFSVSGTLGDPILQIYRGSELLRWTDDWDSPAFLQPTLSAAFTQTSAFQFTDRQESALLVTLPPGAYTLQVRGFENGTGIALVEAYEMPN